MEREAKLGWLLGLPVYHPSECPLGDDLCEFSLSSVCKMLDKREEDSQVDQSMIFWEGEETEILWDHCKDK